MIVRLARSEDAASIIAIQNPVIRETAITFNSVEKTEADIVRSISELPCFLVLEERGEILGFASYDQFRKGAGYVRTVEHTIILAPKARGKGAGHTLMSAVESHARTANAGSIWAGVSGENSRGIKFHLDVGFEKVARLPRVGFKFDRWMDLVLMRKWLGDDRDNSD